MRKQFSTLKLSPQKAKSFLELNTYEAQRNMNPSWVKELRDKIRGGTYHVGNVVVASYGKTKYLLDGQQSCQACVEAGKAIDVTFQEYTCEQEIELAQLFAEFAGGKPRSAGQVAWAYAVANGIHIPKRGVQLTVAGLSILRWGLKYAGASKKKERAELLNEHGEDCLFVGKILFEDECESGHLKRAPVVAAMLASFQRNKQEAQRFWRSVRDGDMLTQDDPAFKLRNWLVKAVITGSNTSRSHGFHYTSNHEMFCRCVMAWNAFRGYEISRYRETMDLPQAA